MNKTKTKNGKNLKEQVKITAFNVNHQNKQILEITISNKYLTKYKN